MLCSTEIILNKFHEILFFIKVQHTWDTDQARPITRTINDVYAYCALRKLVLLAFNAYILS